ncbi:MAG: acylphosphatase [Hyphomicrobiaceae bacterium]|nr:acylphosphatase [Hyphomicrobiaceae bacterium]
MGEQRSERRAVRVRIEGGVQGVGYRFWTERVADDLSLTGWVRNRRDGSVEALFCGPANRVADMLERCKQGPPAARVTAVKILAEADPAPETFSVLATA